MPKKSVEMKKPEKTKKATEKIPAKIKLSKNKRKVLLVGSEAYPFVGTGELGESLGGLSRAINDGGEYQACVILPLYESFPQERRKDLEFMCWTFVPLAWRNQYCGLFRITEGNTVYYFVDNEYYFKRNNLYGYYDDGERFAFFCRAVLELLPKLDFSPDILHCHDWQTALVPIYYKLFYANSDGYRNIKTVFTIHNIEYQGWYNKDTLSDVFGISESEFGSIEHFGEINLMKGAIDYADAITSLSPTYADELMQIDYAHGLDGDIRRNSHKLRGILNGINTDIYDPETNPSLFAHYSADVKKGKAVNKAGLQKMLWLPVNKDVPIIAMITRFDANSGMDIVRAAMPELLARNVQFIVLGTGEHDHEAFFSHMQEVYDNKMRAIIAANTDMAQQIYSGADILLMPSKIEPCGSAQMIACRYGTVPVVRETGGLNDSVVDAYNGDFGNGYKFARHAADDLIGAIDRAVGLYNDYKDKWAGLVDRAMRTDFSWSISANKYVAFYNEHL